MINSTGFKSLQSESSFSLHPRELILSDAAQCDPVLISTEIQVRSPHVYCNTGGQDTDDCCALNNDQMSYYIFVGNQPLFFHQFTYK